MPVNHRIAAAAIVAGLAAAAPSRAASYTAEYVFGDSLSDNGNLAEVYYRQNLPNPPSYHDSFTNGPVAPALLATSLGLTLTPSLWVTGFQDVYGLFGGASYVPGTNYAVAGATAAFQAVGGPPSINLPQQVAAFSMQAMGAADPNALYVVDIGSNDVRAAVLASTGAPAVTTGVQTELAAIGALAAEGAKKFLIVNVPNLGVIPEFATTALAATATAYSQLYNALLASGLAALALPPGTSLTAFDLYAAGTALFANAASYGLTNTTTPCYTSTLLSAATSAACGPGAVNIDHLAYWDDIHPTETVQALIAEGFESAIGVAEPPGLAVMAMGLLGLIGLRRRPRQPVR